MRTGGRARGFPFRQVGGSDRREEGMRRAMIFGATGAALLILAAAGPLAAAERTFQFDIPGCLA